MKRLLVALVALLALVGCAKPKGNPLACALYARTEDCYGLGSALTPYTPPPPVTCYSVPASIHNPIGITTCH